MDSHSHKKHDFPSEPETAELFFIRTYAETLTVSFVHRRGAGDVGSGLRGQRVKHRNAPRTGQQSTAGHTNHSLAHSHLELGAVPT